MCAQPNDSDQAKHPQALSGENWNESAISSCHLIKLIDTLSRSGAGAGKSSQAARGGIIRMNYRAPANSTQARD